MQQQNHQPKPAANKFHFFAGVILPAISITLEATTHICAEVFFDPIPTIWHLALVIFVPLAQLQTWFAIRRGDPDRLTLAGLMNAAVIGISFFYSIVYIPLIPLAALTLLIALGLLPLAPYFALLSAILMRRQLNRIAGSAPRKSFGVRAAGLITGLGLSFAIIGMLELPATLTRYGLQLAASNTSESRAEGIRFLRSYGSRDYLLRSCYNQTGVATDLLGSVFEIKSPVSTAEAQQIYYRVTGESYASVPLPQRTGNRFLFLNNLDTNMGGTEIGGIQEGLSLSVSKLDGVVDADGGVGYMEWTMTFLNVTEVSKEARAEIQLPPGAVVSRLTLWVNGEEREAAFAGKGHVRQAYQQVVRQRRDPVLVTTAGRDRIMVQCFPVPPLSGEMKIRIGITMPLVLEDWEQARLIFPHFVSRNFEIRPTATHSVWIEAKRPLSTDYGILRYSELASNRFILWGELSDANLANPETAARLARDDQGGGIWSRNPFEVDGSIVRQSIEERTPLHLRRIVLVLDTSASMALWRPQIFEALGAISSDVDLKLVLADSDFTNETKQKRFEASGISDISSLLFSASFAGGADNLPALTRAWDLASETPGNNVIVWIHSPQPVQLEAVEALRRRWERGPFGPTLYSVQTTDGPDEIERQLDGITEVKSVVRLGQLNSDLSRLFREFTGGVKKLEFVRSLKYGSQGAELEGIKTSDHLARLWANDEVARILSAGDESLNDAAIMLASRYQLVTPVTGAVVLETSQQYRNAGLQPVDAGTVPTIPEPETIALLFVAGLFLILLFYVKHRKSGRGTCVT